MLRRGASDEQFPVFDERFEGGMGHGALLSGMEDRSRVFECDRFEEDGRVHKVTMEGKWLVDERTKGV